ncbi:hypothetical protein [Nitrospira sp. Kam-Ns4a]
MNRYKLPRLSPMIWQAFDTLPSGFASSNNPCLVLILFRSFVMILAPFSPEGNGKDFP